MIPKLNFHVYAVLYTVYICLFLISYFGNYIIDPIILLIILYNLEKSMCLIGPFPLLLCFISDGR